MINPKDIPIDIEEQQKWLLEHKSNTGMSWNQIATLLGSKTGTISQFCGGNYKGRNDELALLVFRYRQNLTVQSQLKMEAPEIPSYFETKTSKELMQLLSWAQRGRMTFCAGGPGIGKTQTVREYRDRVSNAFLITMRPSIGTVPALAMEVLRAMGDNTGRVNSLLSTYLISKLRDTQGLLIFDDAQTLKIEQIEEIRGWYDVTGIGVALLGNEEVVSRMEGGSRRAVFAQLYSRVGMRMIRPLPLSEDVDALANEWRIGDEKIVDFIKLIARKPGGLRNCTFALEIASMIASSHNSEMTIEHLKAAWAQLSTRPVAS